MWNEKEVIDFNMWNQEYDLRMKAEEHLVLTHQEVEVVNQKIFNEEMIMDIDLVTSNIHVIR